MFKNVSKLGSILKKSDQKTINGGFWPTTKEECLRCGGEWGILCALPMDSVCL
ncbi:MULTISPECIES: hypothetical protein [Tenacibaculum]|uniref:hypothetical protein n=1 Tax=Tenacibaculum TaxID=104267 RepID=UPI000894BD86|nr:MULTISPECIES: hypothetical protein [unclassified Tenacibaculum]SEE43816.1 hypothetical protein SAMN04487765_2574 [Tenacibaculum sp. MAR_2010_89]